MRNIQPPKKKLYSKPVLILLIVIIVILVKATWNVYQKEHESRQNAAMVQTELEGLKERMALLQKETEKLNSEEGKEEAIRKKFQVSKDGESVLVVVDRPLPATVVEKDENFLEKMWHGVTGIFTKDEDVIE